MTRNDVKEKLDLIGLQEILLVANTPGYLFKHFKKIFAIQQLAEQYSSEELISLFKEIIATENLDLDMLTCIYAILISLSLKPYGEISDFLQTLDSLHFNWSMELKYILISNSRSEQFITKEIKPLIIVREGG